MNKTFLILLLLTLFFKYSFTQNMVINPSFEEVDNKFKTKDVYRLKLANGWSAPESSTDL